MIVAMDEQNGIGLNNKLPWYFKEDMKYFSKITKGNGNNAIVMGKNTWLSLPKKPLPKRHNIILSKTQNYNGDGYETLREFSCNYNYDELWIIGGSQIYNLFMNNEMVDEIHITKIKGNYHCDTFFPMLPSNYKLGEKIELSENIIVEIWKKN